MTSLHDLQEELLLLQTILSLLHLASFVALLFFARALLFFAQTLLVALLIFAPFLASLLFAALLAFLCLALAALLASLFALLCVELHSQHHRREIVVASARRKCRSTRVAERRRSRQRRIRVEASGSMLDVRGDVRESHRRRQYSGD